MRTSTIFTFIIALAFAFSSCKKEGTTVTKVVTVGLASNETYKAPAQPAGDADDVMQLTSQPAHSSSCSVAPDASGTVMVQYTPALNYSGTDEFQVSNVEGPHHGGGGPHGGGCSGHHGDQTIYIYKITITGNTK